MSSTATVVDPLGDDAAYCQAILPEVSRTFALSIEALPETLRVPVRVSYLLCRIVDTIEDHPEARGASREALFDAFDRVLEDDGADPADLETRFANLEAEDPRETGLCRNAGAVLRSFRALPAMVRARVRPHVLTMSRGMRHFSRRGDEAGMLWIDSFEDLEDYCYFVAGTVGELLSELFAPTVPSLTLERRQTVQAARVSFGLGLQLVNIAKDVAVDYGAGRCFLPRDRAAALGLDLNSLLSPEARPAAELLLHEVCARARHHLAAARSYTLAWPVEDGAHVRLFCAAPLVLAFATIELLERGGGSLVPGQSPKLSRERTLELVALTRRAIEDDASLEALLDSGPLAP